jgi:hypothetical protein
MKFNEERRLSREWEAGIVGGKTEMKKEEVSHFTCLKSVLSG